MFLIAVTGKLQLGLYQNDESKAKPRVAFLFVTNYKRK